MKFENTEVFNFENAIRGMRNPLESWNKSDSIEDVEINQKTGKVTVKYIIGEKDLKLMQTLIIGGCEHRKFMRQIFVSVDITAPFYWWKEFDTYKVGTVANSESTMHRLASTPITIDRFEMNNELDMDKDVFVFWNTTLIPYLEKLRQLYISRKDKRYWKELIRLLPESWQQKRTVTMNYENVLSMIHQRKNHKLTEWSVDFMNWTKTLPYSEELLFLK